MSATEKKMTQAQLAKPLGVMTNQIWTLETGRRTITAAELAMAAAALDCSLYDFFSLEEQE